MVATAAQILTSRPRRAISPPLSPGQRRLLRSARTLADLFDTRFSVLGVRFGLDTIVGFVPVVGDAVSAIASGYLLFVAKQLGVPPRRLAQMAMIAGTDFALGLIPFLGDAADTVFKAHVRNLGIIEAHMRAQEEKADVAARRA